MNALPLLAKDADLASHFVVLVLAVLCARLEVLVLVDIKRQLLNESVVYFVETTPQRITNQLLGSSSSCGIHTDEDKEWGRGG